VYEVLRVCLVIAIAAFPIAVRHQLEALNWWYVSPFLALTGILAVVEFLYDREKVKTSKKELDDARNALDETKHRMEHLRERGLSMAHLMGKLLPTMLRIEKTIEGVHDQVEENDEAKRRDKATPAEIRQFVRVAIDLSDQVILDLLKAVAEEVRAYWAKPADSVNSNLMVAHRVKECEPAEMARLKGLPGLKGREFLEFRRGPESYEHLLELTHWGTPDPAVPSLVLPVEGPDSGDVSSDGWREHLIPGAPTALALQTDVVVDDTIGIEKDFPSKLDQHVKDSIVKYFHGKAVRSFMCMVILDGALPIGVLNIEATWPQICGPLGKETSNLTKSIDHYRFCLLQLISGQRRLEKLVA